jgi:uncharacterized protein Usg
MVMLLRRKSLITVNVVYFRPDYVHILNEFIWQTDDLVPELPRVHRFLRYWHTSIDAIISEVLISEAATSTWRNLDFYQNTI